VTVIEKVYYKYTKKETLDFEITSLQDFYATRPRQSIERNNRINFWVILYIFEGQGYHSIDFHKYLYQSGDVIIVEKNQVHRFHINPEVKGYVIHINEPFFYSTKGVDSDVFLELINRSYGSPIVSEDASLESTNRILIELIYKEYSQFNNSTSYRLIYTLFQSFILSIQFPKLSKESLSNSRAYVNFSEFRSLIEENYKCHKTVAEYSKMMKLSSKTINQATREIVGLSAKQYIINRLLLEIKRYLCQGDLLNYEIADLFGFEEVSNMTNFFKRYEGISPKEFRERQERN